MPNKSIIALWLALLIPILACTQEVNSQLIEAAKNGETEKVRAALDSGASVDARDEGIVAETALMLAAQKGHADIVQLGGRKVPEAERKQDQKKWLQEGI